MEFNFKKINKNTIIEVLEQNKIVIENITSENNFLKKKIEYLEKEKNSLNNVLKNIMKEKFQNIYNNQIDESDESDLRICSTGFCNNILKENEVNNCSKCIDVRIRNN